MNKLASSITKIKSHYDVIVIGSGYGGSIAASRMTRGGKSVCLLERGKEFLPGDFPNKGLEASGEMQFDLPKKHIGNETGLFDFRVNKEINSLIGCGLGGTSLINASVAVQAEPRVYDQPEWPKTFREDKRSFFEGVQRAKEYLGSMEYPEGEEGYPTVPKLKAMRDVAEKIGEPFAKMEINVNFKDRINPFGVEQEKCNNCGDCVTGCNYAAKNTTAINYLPDAKNHGAEIFTLVSVKYLEKKEDKWLVHYKLLGSGSDKFDGPSQFVSANIVMLGAGSIGTGEILLRSKENGLAMSERLGKRFNGNGDIVGFGYNTDQTINGVGLGDKKPGGKIQGPGPCIISVIDMREKEKLEDGMVIEEGVIPGALSAFLTPALVTLSKFVGKDTDRGFMDFLKEKGREIVSIFRGAYHGAVKNTITYLVNTHDDGEGNLYLDDDRVRIKWEGVGKQAIFKKVEKNLERVTGALGGNNVKNPMWNKMMDFDLVTVHPLGGSVMADDATGGVVNHKGQVFSGNSGTEVHKGLYVCDGAVIPRPLGANPLLTISGLAERCCVLLAKDYGFEIDYSMNGKTVIRENANKPGIQFTESMKGYIELGDNGKPSYEDAYESAKMSKMNHFDFILTIISNDVKALLEEKDHEAQMTGTVTCKALADEPMTVTNGLFNLFVQDESRVDALKMKYAMNMHTEEGKTYFFEGFKDIQDDPGADLWKDTTTLYVTVYEGENAHGMQVAKGILKIEPADFARQMTTMKAINTDSISEQIKWQARFGQFFSKSLFDIYGGVLDKPNLFNPNIAPRKKRQLRTEAPNIHYFKTSDNLQLRLTNYKGGDKGIVLLLHGLGVSSAIFTIDTIDTNLVEYLYEHKYDVWLLDFRASIVLPASETQFTAEDVATKDIPEAIAQINAITGNRDDIQVVAHCYGATSFAISMLNGLKGVKSAVMSQIGPHVIASKGNKIKSALHLSEVMDEIGIESLTAYTDTNASWKDKVVNTLLKFYPVDSEDKTNDPVSNRISFLYGQLYELDQLNQPTFDALHEMFGVANIDAFKHLSLMIRERKVVSAKGEDVYLPNFGKNMGIPMTFIHGEENVCFLPESTEKTFEQLKTTYKDVDYNRHVIPNYGHIDCIFGKNAHKDVFPYIVEHLEKYVTKP